MRVCFLSKVPYSPVKISEMYLKTWFLLKNPSIFNSIVSLKVDVPFSMFHDAACSPSRKLGKITQRYKKIMTKLEENLTAYSEAVTYVIYHLPSFIHLTNMNSFLEVTWKTKTVTVHLKRSRTASHRSVSGPFLAMIIFSLPRPPTGALSVPVVNCRKRRFCSSPNECNVSQNSLQGRTNGGRQRWFNAT